MDEVLELLDELRANKPRKSPFDDFVPIIADGNITEVFLSDAVEDPSNYDEFCYKLSKATVNDEFIIHLNTPGGIIDSAKMVYTGMCNSKAKITVRCTGTVASAGTIIAMAADELILAPYTAFMIHNYSGGVSGKGHEIKAQQQFVDRELNVFFTEIYNGFLTPAEIRQVIEGKDLWMGSAEVVTRWANKQRPAEEPRKRGRPRKL